MATLRVTATPPPSPAYYSADDAKIYVSTATLKLKQNFDDYKWHTTVVTPQTPEVPAALPPPLPPLELQEAEVYEPECQTICQKPPQQQQHQKKKAPPPPPRRTNILWTPVELHDVPETIYTILGNFMSSERYHSQCNRLMNHTAGSAIRVESTNI